MMIRLGGGCEEDAGHEQGDEHQLEQACPKMPCHGTHLVEVDLAEGDEEHQEHKHRQNGLKHGAKETGSPVE